MVEDYKLAVCLIAKNENPYLQEWVEHHRNIGISHFYIYDNKSSYPIKEPPGANDITVIDWPDELYGSQSRAYMDCCKRVDAGNYDYIAFIDADEFICIAKDLTCIQDVLRFLTSRDKNVFDGLGMSWRFYGQPKPYFETRQPVSNYIYYHENVHIKSFVNPKKVISWPDPHKAILESGTYVNEMGHKLYGPLATHSSKYIWIKHIWTRSLTEFEDKLKRGDANLRKVTHKIDEFYDYNDSCVIKDKI
jgi:hypothetical protein